MAKYPPETHSATKNSTIQFKVHTSLTSDTPLSQYYTMVGDVENISFLCNNLLYLVAERRSEGEKATKYRNISNKQKHRNSSGNKLTISIRCKNI